MNVISHGSTTSTIPSKTDSTGAFVEEGHLSCTIDDFYTVCNSEDLLIRQYFQFSIGHKAGFPTKFSFHLLCFDNQVGATLKLLEKPVNVPEVDTDLSVSIQIPSGNDWSFQKSASFLKMNYEKRNGWLVLCSLDESAMRLPLVNGSLVMQLSLKLYVHKPASFDLKTKINEFESRSKDQLIKDLGQVHLLAGAKANMPAKIITSNAEFPVNVGLLSARNTTFRAIFHSILITANSVQVIVNEFTSKTVEVILHYIYTGKLHQNWLLEEVIVELPFAVEKYNLGLLKEFLDDVLGNVCNVATAAKLLPKLAMFGMKKAERDALNFIQQNVIKTENVVKTENVIKTEKDNAYQ